MEKKYLPTAFLLIIVVALYFMYGEQFSLSKVDFNAYQQTCNKYQSAKAGEVTKEKIQSLVNKVHYLLPGDVSEIKDPLKKSIKTCANELSRRLSE